MRLAIFILVLELVLLAASGESWAQNDNVPKRRGPTTSQPTSSASNSGDPASADKPNKPAPDKRRWPAGLTPEREAAAMTFVRQHHAELVDLLVYLKEQQPAAYEQAVLDLFRASEKLAQQQEQNYERFQVVPLSP